MPSALSQSTGVICYGLDYPGFTGPHIAKAVLWGQPSEWHIVGSALEELGKRSVLSAASATSAAAEMREYATPLREVFGRASTEYPSVASFADVMGGAPCIRGTRIPVYMVLDAIEHEGDVHAALRTYPRLTMQQVKDAIGFAKLVVECPIDNETSPAP